LAQYARKVANANKQKDIELILALKNGDMEDTKQFEDYSLQYTNEAELLKDLVDFSDYFTDIRYRVERAKLVDSDFTLKDTYTPSFYCLEEDGEPQKNTLKEFILNWLQDHTRRQLAVLGEYGQGKSTASLLLSYNLIKQAETDPTTRIPILIELRGKTLRTMQPEELLATWAYRYRIDAHALLLTVLISTVGAGIGLSLGLAIDFLRFQRSYIFRRLCLWHQACLNLRLQPKNIEKAVGKGMRVLLAEKSEK